MRRGVSLLIVIAVMTAILSRGPAEAHPHAWIDLRSEIIFASDGRIVSLYFDWLFDDFYTEFILEDIKRVGEATDVALRDLARENLKNLSAFDYFTVVRADGVRQEFAAVERFETAVRGNRLWMRFELRLTVPVDPRRQEVIYTVFDPTYYIEMLHLEGDVIQVNGAAGAGCDAVIIPPVPTPETIANAAALDRTQSGGNSLGEAFAELVAVRCN
jgi:ABC-type uncharacterized transport system substrate-binding protein